MYLLYTYLLVTVRGIVHLLPNVLERFHTLSDLLQTPIDFTCKEEEREKKNVRLEMNN